MLALLDQGIKVDKYVAYEIDKYAVKTATHNFPEIEQRGDVFNADFTEFRNFDYLMGGSPCFVAGTMVKTDTGIKPIEEIKVGDKVLTHKGRYKTVKEVMQRESPNTVIVKAENCGEIECTDEHPFYTKDIVRKWNQDKRCYDRVLDKEFCWTDPRCFHTIRNSSDTIMQQTYLTSVADAIFTPVEYTGGDIKVNQNTIRHVKTLNLDNEAIWYVIGRWLGDGWFNYKYRNGKHLSGIKICCGKHEVEDFEKRLKFAGLNYVKNEERTVVKFTVSNVELALYLKSFGDGAKNKHLSNEVYTLPKSLALSFLEGYFDADGHMDKHIGSFSTISKELAYGIKYMINKYYKTTCSISKELNHSSKIEGRSVNVSEIYTGVFQTKRQNQSHFFIEDNYLISPYKSVTKINKPKTVYNLSVEDDESYTANGLVVHNCTYWSIAQKNNRETEASGLGWELFSQYVRALREAEPKYFIYENNKSMSNAIRESITETFGFEPICINSALLSAQNRQRLYWVGKRNDDGTYGKVEIEQPSDKGILLKDILENGSAWQDKSFAYTTRCQAATVTDTLTKHRHTMVAEPVIFNVPHGFNKGGVKYDKSPTLTAQGDWQHNNFISEPVNTTNRVGSLPRPNGELSQSQAFRVYDIEGKSVNLTSGGGGAGGKTGLYAVPLKVGEVNGGGQGNRIYSVESKLDKAVEKFGYIPEMWNPYNNAEITDKAPTQTAQCASKTSSCTVFMTSSICYAEPCEWDEDGKPIKAISFADGKTYQVYEVKNGLITIKGKEYPIKLADGFYIIRKLTVLECMRLQTVPEWYDFSVVSDTQAYKMLGNGWTVAVISYLLSHTIE